MKKFTALLMAILICCSMVMGVSAASGAVEAEPVPTFESPTTKSAEDAVGEFVSKVIEENQEEVENATGTIESLSATISKILDALDNFLRSLRIFVDQFLSRVLGNGSMPF